MKPLTGTLIITGRTPTGAAITLYRTPAGLSTGPTPVGAVEITWSRPSPIAHCDAADIHLTIAQPATAPMLAIDYDTELTVSFVTKDHACNLALCWVTGWTRTVDANGIAWYDITAEDVIGRAESTRVSGTWPRELASARIAKINAASPTPLIDPTNASFREYVRPLVAVNEPVLSLAQRALDPTTHQLAPHLFGVRGEQNGGYINDFNLSTYTARYDHDPGVAVVPTGAVIDTGRAMSRALSVTHIEVTYPDPDDIPDHAKDKTFTVVRAGLRGPTSQHSIATDALIDPPAATESTMPRLRAIVAESGQSVAAITPTLVLLDDLPGPVIQQLLDMGSRASTCIYLDGPLAQPAPRVNFVTEGRITAEGGELTYGVTLTPGIAAAIRELTWRDYAQMFARGTFRSPTTTGQKTTFRHTRTTHIHKET